jgi:hypothetical protein
LLLLLLLLALLMAPHFGVSKVLSLGLQMTAAAGEIALF